MGWYWNAALNLPGTVGTPRWARPLICSRSLTREKLQAESFGRFWGNFRTALSRHWVLLVLSLTEVRSVKLEQIFLIFFHVYTLMIVAWHSVKGHWKILGQFMLLFFNVKKFCSPKPFLMRRCFSAFLILLWKKVQRNLQSVSAL